MKKILAVVLTLVMLFTVCGGALASYDPTMYYGYNGNNAYYGDNYYNNNYKDGYWGSYYMSPWAEDLELAYEPTWYESPQRQVARGEAFLLFLRAVQRSLDRQGYSRLMTGYLSVPFSDYYTVNTYAQGEVNVLYANGILVGYNDNTMKFSKLLTRAEMAAIYSRFNRIYFNMGVGYNQWNYDGFNSYYNNNFNSYYNNYMYTDIQGHWAEQDILTASANGVLRGVGYNAFKPDEPLTIEQIWKILDCCVGYQGLKRADIAYAMQQTFKVKFDDIDESYGTADGEKITKITASSNVVNIDKGETKNIKVNISPTKAAYQKLNWTSSDTKYVSIEESWNSSNGIAYVTVYGRRVTNGYITLTGRAMDGSGKSVTIKINVNDEEYEEDYGYITSLTPSETTVYLDSGEAYELSVRVKPSDAEYKELGYSSSNRNIVYITDEYTSGNYSYVTLNADEEGTAYVYIKAQDGSGIQEKVKVVVTSGAGNPSVDKTAPIVTLEGADSVDIGEPIIITAKAYDETGIESFDISVDSISGMTGSLSPSRVKKISSTEYEITLMGVEVATQCICVVRGAAVDTSGNVSEESNEIVIFVNSGE